MLKLQLERNAPIIVIDTDTLGERHPIWAEIDRQQNRYKHAVQAAGRGQLDTAGAGRP